MSLIPPTPPSPGVGFRRKGPKSLPTLPASAFSPPNSGASEQFPLAPSPSKVHPEHVVDAGVIAVNGDVKLNEWKKDAGQVLGGRIGGVVVALPEDHLEECINQLKDATPTDLILSVAIPFRLHDADHSATEAAIASLSAPFSLTTIYTSSSPTAIDSLKWALQKGRPVDIDVHVAFDDDSFEKFEDFLTKATDLPDEITIPSIILTNLLPPPDDLELPIVKLMNHPTYRAFQARIASLSLFPYVHVKFTPPAWDSAIPSTPAGTGPNATQAQSDAAQRREWKRRIKMYLGPVMEAFGFRRILFASAPSGFVKPSLNAGDWYEIARESLAELAVEQQDIDDVFYHSAKKVYTLVKQ